MGGVSGRSQFHAKGHQAPVVTELSPAGARRSRPPAVSTFGLQQAGSCLARCHRHRSSHCRKNKLTAAQQTPNGWTTGCDQSRTYIEQMTSPDGTVVAAALSEKGCFYRNYNGVGQLIQDKSWGLSGCRPRHGIAANNVSGLRARAAVGLAFLLLLVMSSVALSGELTGQASVIDGDTLEIRGQRIRLWGIDTPESSQLCRADDSRLYRCGAKAANELDAFIAGRPVSCAPLSQDQYGRTVASCSVNGIDLGEWLVRSGLALDWPQYSKGRYAVVQREADRAGRGVWAGSYVAPWLYRACVRAQGSPTNCSDDANAHP
jgi:endonuclease YncB( thermonuclease family)